MSLTWLLFAPLATSVLHPTRIQDIQVLEAIAYRALDGKCTTASAPDVRGGLFTLDDPILTHHQGDSQHADNLIGYSTGDGTRWYSQPIGHASLWPIGKPAHVTFKHWSESTYSRDEKVRPNPIQESDFIEYIDCDGHVQQAGLELREIVDAGGKKDVWRWVRRQVR